MSQTRFSYSRTESPPRGGASSIENGRLRIVREPVLLQLLEVHALQALLERRLAPLILEGHVRERLRLLGRQFLARGLGLVARGLALVAPRGDEALQLREVALEEALVLGLLRGAQEVDE